MKTQNPNYIGFTILFLAFFLHSKEIIAQESTAYKTESQFTIFPLLCEQT